MKYLKLTTLFTLLVIFTGGLSIFLLNYFFNPNAYKTILSQKIMDKQGIEVHFNGELSWTLFPRVGLQAKNVSISNPVIFGRGNFADIYEIDIGIQLSALLHGQIKIGNLHLLGANIALIKNKNGIGNWQFKKLSAPTSPSQQAQGKNNFVLHANATKQNNPDDKKQKQTKSLIAETMDVELENLNITFNNEKNHKTYRLQNFYLEVHPIRVGEETSIKTEFETYLNKEPNPVLVTFAANVFSDFKEKDYLVKNIILHLEQKKNYTVASQITADAKINLSTDTVRLENLGGNIANMHFKGDMNFTNIGKNPKIQGNIQIPPFDLKDWFRQFGNEPRGLKIANAVGVNLQFSTDQENPTGNLMLTIGKCQIHATPFSNLKLHAQYGHKLLSIDRLSANILHGSLLGEALINFDDAKASLHLALNDTQFDAWKIPIAHKNFVVSGSGDLDLTAKLQGKKSPLKKLAGEVLFTVRNGKMMDHFIILDKTDRRNSTQLKGNISIKDSTIRNVVISPRQTGLS